MRICYVEDISTDYALIINGQINLRWQIPLANPVNFLTYV